MLKLFVNNIQLNLDKDFQVNLIIENAFMLVDRVPSPFMLSADITATPVNLKAFNYPSRINAKNIAPEMPGYMSFGGVVFTRGFFKIKAYVANKISISFRASSFDDNFQKKLYEVPMERFDFGVSDSYNNQFFPSYKSLFANINSTIGAKFVVAPVLSSDYTGQFKTDDNPDSYLNDYWLQNSEFYLYNGANVARMFPAIYIHYLVDTIFGNLLINNPFKDVLLKDLILQTQFHANNRLDKPIERRRYFVTQYAILDVIMPKIPIIWTGNHRDDWHVNLPIPPEYKIDTWLTLNSYCPDIKSVDFLKEMLKLICASLYPVGDRWEIVPNKTIINSTTVESWQSKLIGIIDNYLLEKQQYVVSYSETVTETVDKLIESKEVTSIAEVYSTEIPVEFKEIYIKVAQTGQIFRKFLNDGEYDYELIDDGLALKDVEELPTDVEKFEITTDVQPLQLVKATYMWFNSSTGKNDTKTWFVPKCNAGVSNRDKNLYIGFWQGNVGSTSPGRSYPTISPYNYTWDGVKKHNLTLRLSGEDGIINTYHTEMKEWVEKEKYKISGSFLLSALDLKNLDLKTKKVVNGRRFYVEKIQVTIKIDEIMPALVDLIEA